MIRLTRISISVSYTHLEVREKELQCLEEVELLDNHDPAVEFESDSESEAYDFLEKESGLLPVSYTHLDVYKRQI